MWPRDSHDSCEVRSEQKQPIKDPTSAPYNSLYQYLNVNFNLSLFYLY